MKYDDRHKGEIILALGSGPSLKNVNKKLLRDYTVIGANNIFKFYDPDYLMMIDRTTRMKYEKAIQNSRAIKFYTQDEDLPWIYHRYIMYNAADGCPFLAKEFNVGLKWSFTSIFPAISLAYIFGAAAVVLLGVDMHNNAHYYPDDDGTKNEEHEFRSWEHIKFDMERLATFCSETGFKVYNGNRDSAVKCFPFVDFTVGGMEAVKRGI